MVSLMSGEGKRGGRLYVGDGAIRKDIPKLAHLRATTSSSGPAIERRPQPGLDMLHQFEARLEEQNRLRQEETRLRQEAHANAQLQQDQAMKMQQALLQQQEFMVKQQSALQETFARLRANMQGSTLPDLPPLPSLPTFSFCSQSGQGSNNFVVPGSIPTQASPVTPTTAHGASTSLQE
ncbi:hypothetical protein ACQJBY_024783 [Aegilops geniculata]